MDAVTLRVALKWHQFPAIPISPEGGFSFMSLSLAAGLSALAILIIVSLAAYAWRLWREVERRSRVFTRRGGAAARWTPKQ